MNPTPAIHPAPKRRGLSGVEDPALTDPAMPEVRHNARMGIASAVIAEIVRDEAHLLDFDPTHALLDIDWNGVRVSKYGRVSEKAVRLLLRAWAATR